MQGFRLSPQQERLWLLQQEHDVYRVQVSIALTGRLDTAVLETAFWRVIARHEMLRATFHRQAELKFPLQCVVESSALSWHRVDLSTQSALQQAATIMALAEQERRRPVDLEYSPLWHGVLLVLSAARHVLLITLPALCADAWSLQNLLRDLSQAYAAGLQGQSLDDEPVQYLQFAEWQHVLLEDEDAEAGKEYWQQQDLSTLPGLTLPFARKTWGTPGFEPDVVVTTLDSQLVASLKTLAQQYAASLPALLLAAWQTLLWRLTGQADFVVGYVCDGRKYAELHSTLGLLAKWVPVRGHCEATYAYRDLVERAQAGMQAAYQWQEYFTSESGHEPAGGAGNLAMGFEFAAQPGSYEAAGVSFALDSQYVCYEKFTVHLVCVQQDETLSTMLYYNTEVLDSTDVHCLAGQFQTLLASAASNPEGRLDALALLSQEEYQRLLVTFNTTTVAYPRHTCIHQLFEAQAARTPDKVALVCEDQALTYSALNARANQLAHYLQRLGIGPEIRVALCLERSLDMVIGILGILKAGGAYVPLDSGQPSERLTLLLADTRAPVVLTQRHLSLALPENGVQHVCLDGDWDSIAQESDETPQSGVVSANVAYVMYTSGSTGRPKGVAVEHRQLLNYLQAIIDRLELQPDLSYAMVSTFAADLGHTMLFPALCHAGCLHVMSQERAFDPKALADYFSRQPIDCLKIVPSHLAGLLTSTRPARVLPRQLLVLGGEACPWEVVEPLPALAPACRIFNHYGPTEATVGVMAGPVVPGNPGHRTATLPLGSPLANTHIYILDAALQPVPTGVPGEVYIGGAGLARGYLQDSVLTAEKFLPHPFSDTPGARLYRTGDRARFLPDGSMTLLGRLDQQIKLRGFRIEPGEVETALSQHPGVRDSVVVAREDGAGGTRLVAYVVARQGQALRTEELRRFMQEKLPDYMVPSAFVGLPALPLTTNGKVNRQSLPAPGQAADKGSERFVAPRTAVEEILAGIWSGVLGRSHVGVHDNFFALGGHSLLGIQVLARVRSAFQVEVPPRCLFETPTVAGLAEALIAHEARPGQVAAMARLRQEMENKSPEEIRALLQDKRQAQR